MAYDPALALYRRRRARDTIVSSSTVSMIDGEGLATALRTLAEIARDIGDRHTALEARVAAQDQRIAALEAVIARIGELEDIAA